MLLNHTKKPTRQVKYSSIKARNSQNGRFGAKWGYYNYLGFKLRKIWDIAKTNKTKIKVLNIA